MVEKKRRLGNGLDVKNVSAQQLSHHTLQVKDLASYSASQLREASKRGRLGHGMSDSSQLPVRTGARHGDEHLRGGLQQ